MADEERQIACGRPNIVLIHCHDLGRHLGCYGADVETPNVDALADEGALFRNHFVSAPQCSPSRGSLHTGMYPHNNGLMGLASRGEWRFNQGVTPLPALLREHGYQTSLVGVQHAAADAGPWVGETGRPERLGFEHVESYDEDLYRAEDVADRFAERVDDLAMESPFFASLGFSEPHRPFRKDYVDDEAYDSRDPEKVTPPSYLPDTDGLREDTADLHTLIAETLDPAVGRISEALGDAGIEEETILAFTTDHGAALPRAKMTCYDPGIESALLVRYPETVPESAEYDELLSNVDIFPTLCDFAGVDVPTNVDGRSFAPLLLDDEYTPRNHVYAEMTFHGTYDPMRVVRTEEYKYIRSFSDAPLVSLPGGVIDSPSAEGLIGRFLGESRPVEQLYDLESDPHEQQNLASDRLIYEPESYGSDPGPEHGDVLVELREQVEAWMRETDDPLLDGPPNPPYPGLNLTD
jgi:N-sulfoglucosamine sulfohydrolase